MLHLEKNYGLCPADSKFVEYRERVEKFILLHFDILKEELANPKKFRDYCSKFTSKVRDFYNENGRLISRMLEDESHKVVSHSLY